MTPSEAPAGPDGLAPDSLKQALLALTELDEVARAARLAELDLTEPELARRLRELLPAALHTAPGLRVPSQWLQGVADGGLPTRLGPWRVLGEIGRGGMGVVLLGERADGAFAKQAAIKVLPPALFDAQGARRLAAEAGWLARLEHPNIARLLDAGFDGGCAYLVMVHVQGQHITRYAEDRQLSWQARVGLLLQLCGAVQFAHAQLLVHRDLKPANVMVDEQGQVRLLDFGIAKVLASGEDATATRQAACTPAYASPEQLLGQPVTVASDVFSLGVLAWELLSGQRPFGAAAADGQATSARSLSTLRAVLEEDPDPRMLQRAHLGRDLQAVLGKALEKVPARRYASVDALADDLQACLDGRPVRARPARWHYLAGRFVARHRWAVGAASLGLATVLGFAGWALWNAREAQAQRAVAQARLAAVRAIANQVVFEYNRLLEPVPGTLALRQVLVADALRYLDALRQDAQDDPALRADIAAGFEAVGDVQGRGATGANLGDLAGAARSYEQALQLRQAGCAQGWVAPASEASGAVAGPATPSPIPIQPPASAPPSVGSAGVAPGSLPDVARSACVALARTRVRLGDNAFTQGRLPQALPQFEQALADAERALAAAGSDAALRLEAQDARFDAVQRLAGVSTRQTGEAYARGLALAETQLAAAQALVALAPSLKAHENLRVAQDFMAVRQLAEGRTEPALAAVRQAIATARRLQDMRPGRDADIYLATSLSRLAEIQAHRLAPDEARAAAREALDLAWARHQAEPEDRHLRGRLANLARRFGQVNLLIGDARALADNRRELPRVLAVSAVFGPADGVFHLQHLGVRQELAATHQRLGQWAQADALLAHLPPRLPEAPRAAADLVEPLLLRAQGLVGQGRRAEALAQLPPLLDNLAQQLASTPSQVTVRQRLAWAQAWGANVSPPGDPQAPVWREAAALSLRDLQARGQLSPWWRAEFGRLGLPTPG